MTMAACSEWKGQGVLFVGLISANLIVCGVDIVMQ
jgi:hypothetical protein